MKQARATSCPPDRSLCILYTLVLAASLFPPLPQCIRFCHNRCMAPITTEVMDSLGIAYQRAAVWIQDGVLGDALRARGGRGRHRQWSREDIVGLLITRLIMDNLGKRPGALDRARQLVSAYRREAERLEGEPSRKVLAVPAWTDGDAGGWEASFVSGLYKSPDEVAADLADGQAFACVVLVAELERQADEVIEKSEHGDLPLFKESAAATA